MSNSTTAQSTVQPTQFVLHPTVAQDARTRRQRYQAGFDAYCAGLGIFELYDPDEQRGWWAANSAEAMAGNPAYANACGV